MPISKLQKILEKIHYNKSVCIHSNDFYGASDWRDIERYLNGLSIGFDVSIIFARNSKNSEFNEILHLIKKEERREKLKKLAKL